MKSWLFQCIKSLLTAFHVSYLCANAFLCLKESFDICFVCIVATLPYNACLFAGYPCLRLLSAYAPNKNQPILVVFSLAQRWRGLQLKKGRAMPGDCIWIFKQSKILVSKEGKTIWKWPHKDVSRKESRNRQPLRSEGITWTFGPTEDCS